MKYRFWVIPAMILSIGAFSCASAPNTKATQSAAQNQGSDSKTAGPEETFDPSTISKELFDSTKSDVQALIDQLSTIIREKKFDVWVSYLSPSYREYLSSPEFLKKTSESSILQKQKISLNSLEDYFLYVVVPSRTKDRVDDIEFMGQNRVKAFTINAKGQRLRLYDLEKTASGWKIIN